LQFEIQQVLKFLSVYSDLPCLAVFISFILVFATRLLFLRCGLYKFWSIPTHGWKSNVTLFGFGIELLSVHLLTACSWWKSTNCCCPFQGK